MRRYHLLELHEAPWFPPSWRRLFLDGLGYTITRLGMYHHAVGLLASLLQRVESHTVLDLCTGSAGPVMQLCRSTANFGVRQPRVVLSDLYPNVSRFRALRTENPGDVDFYAQPIDARAVPNDAYVPRVRTILSALHHFEPQDVRRILADAALHADGVLALECTGRSWRNVLRMAITAPVSSAIITAFLLRPWRISNVFYSLVFPIIPFTAMVDSVVSTMRSYTAAELQNIVGGIAAPNFVWQVGTLPVPGQKIRTTFVMGWRQNVVAMPSSLGDGAEGQTTDGASLADGEEDATHTVAASGSR